jgi:hypothetical protein
MMTLYTTVRKLTLALTWFSFGLLKATYSRLQAHARQSLALPASTRLGEFVEPNSVITVPAELVTVAVEPVPVQLGTTVPSEDRKPHQERTLLVMGLLDEAWGQGLTTYSQLIHYVQQQSGEACSRRAIANWKRERGLLSDAA